MQRNEKNGLEWLTFDLLSEFPKVTHAVFTKVNLGLHTEDNQVPTNLERVKEVLGIERLISSFQVHQDRVAFVDATTNDRLEGFDALLTKTPNLALLISHADCQCALFYDPIHHALANVHCGWRGSVQNIYRKTIQAMQERFNTTPSDLLVCISPSLGPAYAEFCNYEKELPSSFWEFKDQNNFFDFWEISRMQLEESGILPHHVEIAKICTYSNPSDFFSYRRETKRGTKGILKAANASVAALG